MDQIVAKDSEVGADIPRRLFIFRPAHIDNGNSRNRAEIRVMLQLDLPVTLTRRL